MKKIILALSLMGCLFTNSALAKGSAQRCETKQSLNDLQLLLTNTWLGSWDHIRMVKAYEGKEGALISQKEQMQSILNSLNVLANKDGNERQIVDGLYDLIMAANELQKTMPLPKDLNSGDNQRLGGDIQNISQIVIRSVILRNCIDK